MFQQKSQQKEYHGVNLCTGTTGVKLRRRKKINHHLSGLGAERTATLQGETAFYRQLMIT
jgi:hypothetical protein